FSDTLLEHSRRNVEALVEARGLHQGSFVVELASNDGYLLQYYVERGISVLGIDPAPGPVEAARQKGVDSLCEFFVRDLAERLRREGRCADVIHANNVLAHVADTQGFVAGICTLLKEHGVAVIEVPYVRDLIDHCEFDTIYHEHLCYFSVSSLVPLLERQGLFLNRVEKLSIHGGSLRLFREPRKQPGKTVENYLEEEAEQGVTQLHYYEKFSTRVNEVKSRLLDILIAKKKAGKRLAAYGAAAKGAILLNYMGIGRDLIDFVADRNVHKQGRFMPGVHIPIADPSRILEERPDYLLLLPWNFKKEILEQQAEYRRAGGKFIIPIPYPEIV
ncbi:MAG: class I SAM-dependent methyltransferase, partial [Planctomycetota bacterium]